MKVQRLSRHGVLEGNLDFVCGGVDTRGAWGEKAARLRRAVEQHGCQQEGPLTECQAWPQLHSPKEGGRSRASYPMDGATIAVKYLFTQTPTTNAY